MSISTPFSSCQSHSHIIIFCFFLAAWQYTFYFLAFKCVHVNKPPAQTSRRHQSHFKKKKIADFLHTVAFAAFSYTAALAEHSHAVAFSLPFRTRCFRSVLARGRFLPSCLLDPLHTHLFIQSHNSHGRPPFLTISSGNTSVRGSTVLVTKCIQFPTIAPCSTVSVFVSSIIS